jgi:hypothetical protein
MQNQPNAQNQINQARPSFFSIIISGFFGLFRRNKNDKQVYPIEEMPNNENDGLEEIQKMLNGMYNSNGYAWKNTIGENLDPKELVIENIEDLMEENIKPSPRPTPEQASKTRRDNQKLNYIGRYNF